MVAMPEKVEPKPPVVLNASPPNLTGEEERADLKWGDEGPKIDAFIRPPHAGQAVVCSDGYAGRIVATTSDASGQLRTAAVRLGRLWGREVSVPAGWIESYDRTTMRLGIERKTLRDLPARRSDVETVEAGFGKLRVAGILRSADYGDVSIAASDGMVTLSGHVGTSTDSLRAEGALREVPGVLGVQNTLVADDDLVNLVAQALAGDERTSHETIFVAVNHGIVILSGLRNSAKARAAAEECAGQIASVRGVSNYIAGPGAAVDSGQERVMQPRIGREVLASDMSVGDVAQVIINPDDRRVVAIVVHGRFPDRRHATPRMRSYEMQMEERRVVIPMARVSLLTSTVVQLSINGIAAAGHHDFAPADFIRPDPTWRPPYPYAKDECLWTRP